MYRQALASSYHHHHHEHQLICYYYYCGLVDVAVHLKSELEKMYLKIQERKDTVTKDALSIVLLKIS